MIKSALGSTFAILAGLLLLCGQVRASDGFEGVRCGGDITKALIGKRMSNEPVVAIEGRHKDLALKDRGADELDNGLSLEMWSICGADYMFLSGQMTYDVLAVPPRSKAAAEFDGACQLNGKDTPGYYAGVVDNRDSKARMLPGAKLWLIDEKKRRFVPADVKGLSCDRSGVVNPDGG